MPRCGEPQLWLRRRLWRLQRQSLLQFAVHALSSARADGDWFDLGHGVFAFGDIPQGETLLERCFAVSFRLRRIPCTVASATCW